MNNQEEQEILGFWKKNKIYEKSKKKNCKGKKFYLMDGPPYATGHIHMGTALNKVLKDIAMRSHRLQGDDVFDRAGYDTHGVPIEFQIEKEIGSKSKRDIEDFGVKKFIDKCKEFATRHIDEMNKEFENLGVWMNFDNPYLTLNPEYIEKIWETFKEADKKKLLYLGKYPVHICPRCETAVSYNEVEYAKQEDNSIFVKFPLKSKKNTYLIIWTTTPWTLPANTGVMVHPDYVYQEIETSSGERWIIAKDLVPKIMSALEMGYTAKKEYQGKEMKGWEYTNPLAENLKMNLKNSYKVVLSARYVNLEDGTGMVHSAPGHGKEDYEVGKENKLDMPSPVGLNGLLTEEAGKYSGKKARIVDEEIINDLLESQSLVYKMKYSHDYPLCWRCKSPLLMVAQPQWFFKISEIQKKLIRENQETNWIPSWMKMRMNAWLEGLSDWPVSRMRYWGTPLHIWKCECGEQIVIGSVKELEKLSGKKIKEVHKPEIDWIEIKCKKCKKMMKRVPEVLDVWFDSGVSSWGALNDKEFKKFWPADLNIEGKDQVRGWWNSQLILSEIKFDKKPFENVSVHGMILDLGKRKMSKSLGNIITPQEIINKFGRDYMRFYFAKVSKGEDFSFDEKDFDSVGNFFRVFVNLNNFINQLEKKKSKKNIEDLWILSKFNSLAEEVIGYYNEYKYPEAVMAMENFLNVLSKNYIQMIRERSDEVYDVMNEIFLGYLKLLAPICPFVTEKIWQEKKFKEESIHLSAFPKKGKTDEKLQKDFEIVLKIIEAGLRQRDVVHIGLKWPLAKATILGENFKLSKDTEEVIKRQLNVKMLEFRESQKDISVELDTIITPELEAEGFAREISRGIQAERKKAGLVKNDLISLEIVVEKGMMEKIESFDKFIKERVNAKSIIITTDKRKRFKYFADLIIKEKRISVSFEKI